MKSDYDFSTPVAVNEFVLKHVDCIKGDVKLGRSILKFEKTRDIKIDNPSENNISQNNKKVSSSKKESKFPKKSYETSNNILLQNDVLLPTVDVQDMKLFINGLRIEEPCLVFEQYIYILN